MGKSSSKQTPKEIVRYVESDESKRIRLLGQLQKQLDELRQEVITVESVFRSNVCYTVCKEQDAQLMRYSQLTDKRQVVHDIENIFGGLPFTKFLVETATKLVDTMTSSQDLQELLRWHERTKVQRFKDKVYGTEIHYKVKVLEETKGTVPGFKSKDTVVLIAYKCVAHVMDLNPADFPDDEEYMQLTF